MTASLQEGLKCHKTNQIREKNEWMLDILNLWLSARKKLTMKLT